MTQIKYYKTNEIGLIKLAGSDSTDFLQRLITADITQLQSNCLLPSALLSPQGKILFEFSILKNNDNYYIAVVKDCLLSLYHKLQLYKLSADIVISIEKNHQALIYYRPSPLLLSWRDPRFQQPNLYYSYSLFSDLSLQPAEKFCDLNEDFVENGIARINIDFTSNSTFPHYLNYDLLKMVSFTKGCFVGQEVVARMQHKATIKTRLFIVKASQELRTGDQIIADNRVVGTIGATSSYKALAVLRLDYVNQAIKQNTPITANNQIVEIIQPYYMVEPYI